MTAVIQALLATHLICMMIASSGPLLACLLAFVARRNKHHDGVDAGRDLAWHSLSTLTFGGLIGFLVGLIMAMQGHRDYEGAFIPLERRFYWGMGEFAFSFVLTWVYASGWRWSQHPSTWVRFGHGAIAFLTATNLLYHFPLLMAVLGNVARGMERFPGPLDAAGFRDLAWQAEPLIRSLHFSIGAFTVGGAWLALRGIKPRPTTHLEPESTACSLATTVGARVAVGAVCLQFPVGLTLLARIDPTRQHQYLGANLLATICLVTSILIAVGLLHALAAMAFGTHHRQSPRMALVMNVLVIYLMVCARYLTH